MELQDNKIGVISLPVNRLHIEITNFCNFSCKFCPDSEMQRTRGFMDFDMLKGILDEVKDKNIIRLILFHVMGEPLLYPRLSDAISYARQKGLRTCVTTNGSLLTDEVLDNMIKAGLSMIIISLQTPGDVSFKMRGARGMGFDEYSSRIEGIARRVIRNKNIDMVIDFLSSPLRRLVIPVAKEFSIADTSKKLREYLTLWAERILKGTEIENKLADVLRQIIHVRSFKENRIFITDRLSFHTRILGDWAMHFNNGIIKAKFGYCPGIQENFGILWNGDYVFCCTDFNGRTSTHNFRSTPIQDYLRKEVVQDVVKGFKRFRVIHTYCKECLGDRNLINALVKQIGSIVYFKWVRKRNGIM